MNGQDEAMGPTKVGECSCGSAIFRDEWGGMWTWCLQDHAWLVSSTDGDANVSR
jgi:hypothetical protein